MISIALEIGLIALLIYLPLASGGVTEVSIALLEIWAGLLVLGWGFSLVFNPQRFFRRREHRQRRHKTSSLPSRSRQRIFEFHVTWHPALGALIGLIAFVGMQLVPCPVPMVALLSSTTLSLYAEAASKTFSSLPSWLPLSVVSQASETDLGKLVAYGLLFWVMINLLRTQAQIQRVLGVLLFLGGMEAVYGLSQVGESRIAGTFVNHNHFAGYLEMLLPLAFGLLLAQLEARSSSTGRAFIKWMDDKYLKIVLLGVLISVLSLALFLSGSRGGILGFSVSMMGFCALAYSRRLLRKWVRGILLCMVVVCGIATFVSPEALLQRLGALAQPATDTSFQYRWKVWNNALEIVRDFPMFGSGAGTFSHLFARYQRFPSDLKFTHAENDYLQFLIEHGLVGIGILAWGLSAYAWPMLMAWWQQHSRWPIAIGLGGWTALMSMAVHSAVDFNLHIPANAVLFTVIAALTYLVVHLERAEENDPDRREMMAPMLASETSQISSSGYVCRAKEHCFRLSRMRLAAMLLTGILVIGGFLVWTIRTYAAFLMHQQFCELGEMVTQGYLAGDDRETMILPAIQSLQYDGNNADYHFALGSYLYQQALKLNSNPIEQRQRAFDEAEEYLRNAVQRDPANPWYYYELARLSMGRETCAPPVSDIPVWEETAEPFCKTAAYFVMALQNAPQHGFLRRQAGQWFEAYDPSSARRMMAMTARRFLPEPIEPEALELGVAQFLYDSHLDYQSDQHLQRLGNIPLTACQSSLVSEPEVVIGSDDGISEWRSFLISDRDRIKKVLCVPENAREYPSAALRIFMNNGGNGNFQADIRINDHLIKQYVTADPVPRDVAWYEIPIDPHILDGIPEIAVYIRVVGAGQNGNFLQVRGDQDTLSGNSMFNMGMTEDLSFDRGVQRGEYMVRLILRK